MVALRNSLIVEPREFKRAFQTVVDNLAAPLFEKWDMLDPFTNIWKDEIYSQIADELSLQSWIEYWYVDAVFFRDSEKMLPEPPDSNYATFLSVAMEHENKPKESHIEMNKLSIYNASLKVLVTYPYSRTDGDALLNDYTKQVKSADVFGDFVDKRRQMAIFGYKENDKVCWEYYLFDGEQFVSM